MVDRKIQQSQVSPGACLKPGRGQPRNKVRHKESRYRLIAGRNPVLEALRSPGGLVRVVLLDSVRGGIIEEIRHAAEEAGISVEILAREDFMEIARGAKAQGVLALAQDKPPIDLESLLLQMEGKDAPGFLLIPDQIEDPGNLGALIRTAECAGADGVIVARHHSASLSPGTIRASAGATEHVPVADAGNLVNAMKELKKMGFWIAGLDGKGDRLYTEVDYRGPIAIVVGSEGKGIRRLVREQCDYLVRIPLFGKIESLNASVAGALVMYEVSRQRATT